MGVYKVTYPGTGKVSYGVDYRDPSGRKIRRVVSDRKKVAEAVWAKIKVELETGAYYDRKQIRTFTIKDLIEKYLEWFKDRRSFETERIHLSAIAAHFDRKTVCDITEYDVIAFRNVRRDTPTRNGTVRTPAAVNREISVLKRLLGKAVTWGMARTNVASGIKPLKEPKGRLRYLEVEEAGKLLWEAEKSKNPHLYPIVLTALETGMRRGEIMRLRCTDQDVKTGRIYIPDTKIGKPRHAPVSSRLMHVLSKIPQHPDNDYFFAGKDGNPFHDVRTSFENACRRAGINDFHFHDLRHTFVTHMIDAGIDLYVIGKIVGHTNATMTERYGHLVKGRDKEAVEKLPDWEKKKGNSAPLPPSPETRQ
jgi:integrase